MSNPFLQTGGPFLVGARCSGIGAQLNCGAYRQPCDQRTYPFHPIGEQSASARLSGKLTDSCLHLRATAELLSFSAAGDRRWQTEAAILVRF